MAEEVGGQDTGAEAVNGAGASADPGASGLAQNGTKIDHGWRLKALATSVAGLIFSLTLSIIIALVEVFLLPNTELVGGDLTMRMYQSASPLLRAPGMAGSAGFNYVFVDVDLAACQVFTECRGRSLFSEDLVMNFVDAAAAQRPRAVIVDWLPETDRQVEFLNELSGKAPAAGPSWVIAPVPARAEVVGNHIVEASDIDTARFNGTRLRLASVSMALDSSSGDGVIHYYPMLNRMSDTKAGERWLPTLPFAAAMLADPQTAPLLDCAFYDSTQCQQAERTSGHPAANLSSRQTRFFQLVEAAKDGDIYNRIFYSLPAPKRVYRALGGEGSAPCQIRARPQRPMGSEAGPPAPLLQPPIHLENFTYACAGWLMKQGRFQLNGVIGPNDIVVLGSSAPQSFDRQVTPIGLMSGAEVILNATRAMADFSPLESPRKRGSLSILGHNMLERMLAAVSGFVFFTPAWFLIFWVLREPRRMGAAAATLQTLLVVAIFLTAMVASLGFELFQTMRALGSGLRAGVLADGLTPILALGLEGFAEGAKWLSTQLEKWVSSGLIFFLPRPPPPPPEDGDSR